VLVGVSKLENVGLVLDVKSLWQDQSGVAIYLLERNGLDRRRSLIFVLNMTQQNETLF
jgi:hypothetical protein